MNRYRTLTRTLQGRALAIQEAQICLACIIQKFDFVMKDPSYELQLKQTMTVKPKDFFIHAVPRTDKIKRVPRPVPRRTASQAAPAVPQATTVPSSSLPDNAPPLYVLYGSNSGSSESFAQRIASDAAKYGKSLDYNSTISSSRKPNPWFFIRFPCELRYS